MEHHQLDETDIITTAYHNHRFARHDEEVVDLLNEQPPENAKSKSR
jgi:hypothetical protein